MTVVTYLQLVPAAGMLRDAGVRQWCHLSTRFVAIGAHERPNRSRLAASAAQPQLPDSRHRTRMRVETAGTAQTPLSPIFLHAA